MHIYLSTNHPVTNLFQFLSIQFLCSFISHCSRASCDSQTTPMENKTGVTEFVLLGLASAPGLQVPLFIVFTLIHLLSVVGSLGMVVLILMDSRLHVPMYLFLSNLSLVDFCILQLSLPRSRLSCLWETRSPSTMRVLLRCSFS